MGRQWSAFVLAWGAVVFILAVVAGLQEFGLRRAVRAVGWLSVVCLALVAAGGAALFFLGVLS